MSDMLTVKNLSASYAAVEALHGVSMSVREGEFVVLLGANGAGKSTLLSVILGLIENVQGKVEFDGEDITRMMPASIVRRGITMAPEGRRVFGDLSVRENLVLGAHARGSTKDEVIRDIDSVITLFPQLGERITQKTGTMSGGEQQMVAIGRALMGRPKLLLLDEPSLGLAPLLVADLMTALRAIHERGTTVLLVEQNVSLALSMGQRAYVLQSGRIVISDRAENLRKGDAIQRAYLGEIEAEAPIFD